MNKYVKIALCATGGVVGLTHGLYVRHLYREQDLGGKFAEGINSASGKVTGIVEQNTQELHIAQNYNNIVSKGVDNITALVNSKAVAIEEIQQRSIVSNSKE